MQDSDLESCDQSLSEAGDCGSELESCEWSEDDTQGHRRTPTAVVDLIPECDWSESTESEVSIGKGPAAGATSSHCTPGKRLALRDVHDGGVRRSPRAPKPKRRRIDFAYSTQCEAHFDKERWQLSAVMEMNGCATRCTTRVHGLTEYDVLVAHSTFWSKSYNHQQQWILDYFQNNCPNNDQGEKDPKNMQYLLCGRTVCQPVWIAAMSISSSRYYAIKSSFMDGNATVDTEKRPRSLAPKSLAAMAWMTSYFERVGDKRPDKDGIYLPTCLTEIAIYNTMVEELYSGNSSEGICFSQFNKVFRTQFPNVTIPKVLIDLCVSLSFN